MRLTDLDASFLRVSEDGRFRRPVPFDLAHGVWFLCPACFAANKGDVGTHRVLVWFSRRGVPEGERPAPRWDVTGGSSLDDLTLSPSIALNQSAQPPAPGQLDVCRWHGWVRNGEAS